MESFGLVAPLFALRAEESTANRNQLKVGSDFSNGAKWPPHSLLPLAVFNHLSTQIKVDQRWQEGHKDRIEVFVCSEICLGSCVVQIALLTL